MASLDKTVYSGKQFESYSKYEEFLRQLIVAKGLEIKTSST